MNGTPDKSKNRKAFSESSVNTSPQSMLSHIKSRICLGSSERPNDVGGRERIKTFPSKQIDLNRLSAL